MKVGWKAALAVAVLSAGLALCAQVPCKNPKVAKELGLTPDQIQKLEDLKYQHEKQVIDVKRDLALKRLDLRRELQKDSPDRAVLDRLTDETSALRGRMQKLRLNHMLDAKKILTPEQAQMIKDRFMERRQHMRERRGDRFQRRDFRGGPEGAGPGAGFRRDQGAAPGGQGAPQSPGPQSGADMGPEAGPGPGPDGPPPPDFAEMMGPDQGFGDDFEGPELDSFEGPLF